MIRRHRCTKSPNRNSGVLKEIAYISNDTSVRYSRTRGRIYVDGSDGRRISLAVNVENQHLILLELRFQRSSSSMNNNDIIRKE